MFHKINFKILISVLCLVLIGSCGSDDKYYNPYEGANIKSDIMFIMDDIYYFAENVYSLKTDIQTACKSKVSFEEYAGKSYLYGTEITCRYSHESIVFTLPYKWKMTYMEGGWVMTMPKFIKLEAPSGFMRYDIDIMATVNITEIAGTEGCTVNICGKVKDGKNCPDGKAYYIVFETEEPLTFNTDKRSGCIYAKSYDSEDNQLNWFRYTVNDYGAEMVYGIPE